MEKLESESPETTTTNPEEALASEEELPPRETLLKFADTTPGREGAPGKLECVHIFEKPSETDLSDFCESVQRKAVESLKNTPTRSLMRTPKQYPMFDYDGKPQVYEYFMQGPAMPKKRKPYKGGSRRRKQKKTKTEEDGAVKKVAPTRMKRKEKKKAPPPENRREIPTRSRSATQSTST